VHMCVRWCKCASAFVLTHAHVCVCAPLSGHVCMPMHGGTRCVWNGLAMLTVPVSALVPSLLQYIQLSTTTICPIINNYPQVTIIQFLNNRRLQAPWPSVPHKPLPTQVRPPGSDSAKPPGEGCRVHVLAGQSGCERGSLSAWVPDGVPGGKRGRHHAGAAGVVMGVT
jgi:hypothetical protein